MSAEPVFSYAITRIPGKNFSQGLTTANLGPPDYHRMLDQHRAYSEALGSIGIKVIELPAEPEYPDAHFVEDTAVVTGRVAVICRPGAAARRGEEETMVRVLRQYRPLATIEPPGTVDGGDVLMVGEHFFVGISDRTNRNGAEQLGRILVDHGYSWTPVPVRAGLHLKSSVNWCGGLTLLMTAEFASRSEFQDHDRLVIAADETYAANILLINGHLLMPTGFPNTRRQLENLEKPIIELETSETRKMDGGLTCLSLRF